MVQFGVWRHKIAGIPARSFYALALLAFFFPGESVAQSLFTASSGSPFAAGNYPLSVAAADFNGDGYADLAIPNFYGNDVTVLLSNGSGGFTAASGSPFAVTGLNPISAAVGDFNNDGHPDLAVSTQSFPGKVNVLLGDGAGGFSPASGSPVTVGTFAESVAVGDFNADGLQDLAVANQQDNNVTVLLGDGTGGFSPATGSPFATGTNPQSVVVGDFNQDGHSDVAVANSGSNDITVLLGDGSAGFTQAAGSPFAGGNQPLSIKTADFNGDGRPDLAIADGGGTVTVLLGDGSGGFSSAVGSPFTAGSDTYSVAATDLNGDGYVDLATVNFADNTATVLLGNGSGGFTAAIGSPFSIGANPASVAAGDFNGDGHPDLAMVNSTDNNVTVLLNSAPLLTANPRSLTFYASAGQAASVSIPVSVTSARTGSTYTVSSSQTWLGGSPLSSPTGSTTNVTLSADPTSLTAGTYSGIFHFIAPNFFEATTSVTLNVTNPSGTLTAEAGSPFPAGSVPYSVAAGDFNGDGHQDSAIANVGSNNVTVLLGDGSGGFTEVSGSPFPAGIQPLSIALGDFNKDGHLDLAVANDVSNDVSVLLGNGSGGFTGAHGSPVTVGTNPFSVTVGDFNGDGNPDLATANLASGNVTVLLGNGFGEFFPASGSPFATGQNPISVAVGDFNGDGRPDLATANMGSNTVSVLLGNGSGGFTAASGSPIGVGNQPYLVAVADFNGDGHPDLAVPNNGSNNITVLLGNGTGGFAAASGSPFAVGSGPSSVAVVDIDGDSYPDLAVTNHNETTVTILLGNGAGGFRAASNTFTVGMAPISIATGDLNEDGRPDLAVANANSSNISVLLGAASFTSSTLTTTAASTITPGTAVPLTLTVSNSGTAFNSPRGTATFYDGATSLGTTSLSGSPYTFSATLGAGSHSLKAVYNGNTGSGASTSNTISVTVLQISQSITFNSLPNISFRSTPLTLTAFASSGLPVSFTSLAPSVCNVSSTSVTLLSAGQCTIQASQAGSGAYQAASPVTVTFAIAMATQTISFRIPDHSSSDAPFTLQATASSGLPIIYSVVSGPATISENMLSITGVGAITVQASQAGSSGFSPATATATFNVTLGSPVAISVGGAASYSMGTLAPNSYAVLFGSSFARQSPNGDGTSARELGGVTITITDSAGNSFTPDIFYASFGQTNFVVPAGIASGPATLTIQNANGATSTATFTVAAEAPGLFTADSSGKGAAAAQALIIGAGQRQLQPAYHCSGGSPVTCSPAPIPLTIGTQVHLILYGTGIRGAKGISVTIGGMPATVEYAGPQGQYPALDQVNVLAPPDLAAGKLQLVLTADGVASNPVTVQFQ